MSSHVATAYSLPSCLLSMLSMTEPIEVPLGGGGGVAIIDAADLPLVARYKWRRGNWGCVAHSEGSNKTRRTIYMHRLILAAPKGLLVDHIDRDPLNNRRSNLRLTDGYGNAWNRSKTRTKTASQYKGVRRCPGKKGWCATIRAGGVGHSLGAFGSEQEAARAYDAAARMHFGEFAVLNFPGQT